MRGAVDATRAFLDGALLPVRALGVIAGRPAWMGLCALPALLAAAAATGVAALWWANGTDWLSRVWVAPASCDGCAWLPVLLAWLESLSWRAAWAMALILLSAAAGWGAGLVLTSPVMDALSWRAMREFAPERDLAASREGSVVAALSSMARSAGRAAIFLAGAGVWLAVSLIPGGGFVATPLAVAWSAAWLFAELVSYPLQWEREPGGGLRALWTAERARCLGLATVALLVSFVPFAGPLFGPVWVVGASLLVAEAGARARGAGADAVVSTA